MSKFIYIISFWFLSFISANATPEFSAWTGNKCSTCHLSENGGGARNNFGYNFAKDASFYSSNDVEFLKPLSNNQLFDGLITYGGDFRMQTTRSHKTENATRRYYPMQMSLYLSANPTPWLSIEAQGNIAPIIFEGQKLWAASMKFTPDESLPYLRLGYFQPAMGLKDCDMTDLDRRVAGPDGTINLIAPDFADLGIEVGYNSLDWLSVQVGIFNNQAIKEVSVFGDLVPIVPDNGKIVASKILIRPTAINQFLPDLYFGASNLTCGLFVYNNIFLGVSPIEDWIVQLKFANSNKPYSRSTQSYIASLSYLVTPGLLLGVKGQYGVSDMLWDKHNFKYLMEPEVWQFTANAKFFPMPFLEVIPEYRFMRTTEYESWRWLVQLHLYY